MTFARLRPTGGWFNDSLVTPAEFEAIDAARPNMIDGGAGGSWAPTNIITIGGAGVNITSTLDVGTLDVDGDASFDGVATFAGQALFSSDIAVTGTSSFVGAISAGVITTTGTIVVGNDLIVADALTVSGISTFNAATTFNAGAAVTFNDGVVLNSSAIIDGALTTYGEASFEGVLGFGTGGHLRLRVANVTDTNMTLSVSTHVYYESSEVLTAARTHTLSDSGAGNGDTIEIRLNNLFTQTFKRGDGSTITSITSGLKRAKFMRIAGQWELYELVDALYVTP